MFFFSVELYYNMLQLLLVIMHFVICQYLQLPLILLIKKKQHTDTQKTAVMAAKHYRHIAKNNILEIKENSLGSNAVQLYIHSFGQAKKILHIVYSFIIQYNFINHLRVRQDVSSWSCGRHGCKRQFCYNSVKCQEE